MLRGVEVLRYILFIFEVLFCFQLSMCWMMEGGGILRGVDVLFHILFIFEVLYFNFQSVGEWWGNYIFLQQSIFHLWSIIDKSLISNHYLHYNKIT